MIQNKTIPKVIARSHAQQKVKSRINKRVSMPCHGKKERRINNCQPCYSNRDQKNTIVQACGAVSKPTSFPAFLHDVAELHAG